MPQGIFGGQIERNIAPRDLLEAISKHFIDNPEEKERRIKIRKNNKR